MIPICPNPKCQTQMMEDPSQPNVWNCPNDACLVMAIAVRRLGEDWPDKKRIR